ncbi:hypothetical protein FUAX_38260 (plasmid) [Fulvitalea axinellae]|uniref:HTH luxR-type domain-containing protein n=1 Tax=Fulvitalea axinellae TaxID=1182444 RepID=A0AAU9CXY1_9BACT|nr:hypothetical protein FUAX_38260 [Fulvitalea axinellae]
MSNEALKAEIQERLADKMSGESIFSNEEPLGFYHVNRQEDASIVFLDEEGCKLYGKSLEEIKALGTGFLLECMHPNDVERCIQTLNEFRERDNEKEILSYFQRIRTVSSDHYELYLTSVRLNKKDNTYCCITCPMLRVLTIKNQIIKSLDTYEYIKSHMKIFKMLSKREVEILSWVCTGMSALEIAECLHLSHHTVEKHKKNIFGKTGFSNNKELMEFALNFNLLGFD